MGGMIIWGALLVPVLVAIILFFFFRHRTVWWEFLIPFAASIVFVGMAKLITGTIGTTDTEWWGHMVVRAEYYEDWDEWVHQICFRQVYDGTDANGNAKYRTESYDCSHRVYHGPEWIIRLSTENKVRVSEEYYNYLVQKFGMKPVFKDLDRNYYHDDGDMYYADWSGSKESAEPVVSQHTYKNKVQVSDDVFNFPLVDTSEVRLYGLYDYPEFKANIGESFFSNGVSNNYPCIFGITDTTAQKDLWYWNAILGPEKECRIMILVYKYPTRHAGLIQEAYWKGGNKNELIIAIGVDDSLKINWCHPISWTENQSVKVNVRTYVESLDSLDLVKIVDYTANLAKNDFQRKHFSDFDYLTIEPPLWSIITTYIIVVIINILVSLFVIYNEINERRQL